MKIFFTCKSIILTGCVLLLTALFNPGKLEAQCSPLVVNMLPAGGFVCTGSSVTLTASGLTTYTWTGGITNGVGFIANSSASYTITGTVSSGTCAGTYSRVVNVNTVAPPTGQTVSGSPASLSCLGNVTVALATQLTAAYYLRNDANNSILSGPVYGTGTALNIVVGNISTATTFNVNAVNLTRAMYFDGVDDQAVINNAVSTTGDFTWEAWFNTSTNGSIMNLSPLSGNWNVGGKSLFIRYGRLSFDCYGIGYMEAPTYLSPVTDNKWHHVTLTNKADYSGILDRTTMYMDGQMILVKSDWDITGPQGTGMVNRIGYTSPNFPTFPAFNGYIDDVKFWSTERSQLEVISDMSSCPPATTAGLEAFYTFEDGTSLNLSDNGSGTHPGVFTNMTPAPAYNGREACSSCSTQMAIKPSVTVSGLIPQTASATTPSFCASGTTTIGLAGSEVGGNYYLSNSTNTTVSGPLAGTGGTIGFSTGALGATTSYTVTGKRQSGALNFDGVDDIVSVVQTPALAQFSTTPMSMEAWVYPTNISTIRSVIRKEGSYNLYLNNGRIYFEMYRDLGNGTNYTITLGQTILPANQWSHIAATWAGGIYANIYLNGVLEVIGGGSSTNNNVANLSIGRTSVSNQPFAGKLDEIRIWNTTRTAAQIKDNMRNCLTGSESGLLLYYKLNDSGTGIVDAAGGDNNGTLLNADQSTVWGLGVDNCGCTLQMAPTPTVVIYPIPVLTVNNPTICSGNSAVITPTGAGASAFYNITGGSFTVNPTTNTSYSVTGTNSVGCAASNTVVSSVVVNATPTVGASSGSICSGQTFTIVPSGASLYSINGGVFAVSPTVTTSYTVTGTTGSCSSSVVTTVTVSANPTITVNSATICSGNSVALVPGGALTYTISGGNFTVSPNTTTSYSVTGTSANGCVASSSAVSAVSVNITPTVTINNPTICSGNTVALIPGGASTYTISGGNFTVSPNTTTSYSVTGTAVNGCVSGNTIVSTVSVNTTPTVTVNSPVICSGNSVALIPGGASTYTISGGNFTVSPNTTTSYSVTGTAANGCIASGSVISTVSVNTTPTVTINNPTICSGNAVALVPGGASSYTISGGNFTVSPNTTTSYSVTGTAVNGCVSGNTVVSTVSVNTTPTVTINNPTICSGNSVALVPSGATTYTISGGSYTVTPGTTTSYTVNGTTNGCISGDAVSTVSVNTTPTLAVNSATICSGNAITIVPTGANTYTITGGTFIVSPNTTSSYSVTGTAANGCIASNTIVSTVSVNATPTVTINNPTICSGNSVALVPNGATTYTISGGSFTVSPGSSTSYTVNGTTNGCISGDAVSSVSVNTTPTLTVNDATICSGNSATIVPTGANTYTVTGGNFIVSPNTTTSYSVSGTAANGCVTSANVVSTISVNITPTISLNSGAICPGNTYTLAATGAGTYTYSSGSPVVSPVSTTTYSATGTGTNGCPAANTAVATVSVVNTLLVSVSGSTNVCKGQSTILMANGASTYSWSTGITTNTISLSPTVNTSYTVTGSAGTCTNTAIVNLSVLTTPTITVNSATICSGSSVVITPTGASTYSISGNNFTVTPNGNTNYTLTGTASNGCVSNSIVSTVSVNPNPTISVNSASICEGESVVIVPAGAPAYTITGGSFTVSPLVNTTYSVSGSLNGCTSIALSTITVNVVPSISVNSGAICPGNSFTLIPTGASTYTYSNGSNVIVNPASTASYSVTGTSAEGCAASNTAVATVSVVSTLSVSIAGPAAICIGETATLTASGASTYSWNTGVSTDSITLNPSVTTDYTVTGASGTCSNTAVITLSVNPLPTVTVNNGSVCLGESFTIVPAGAVNYSITGNTFTVIPSATQGYSLTGSDLNGCVSAEVVSTVTVNPLPSIILSTSEATICVNTTATLTATGAVSYTWNTMQAGPSIAVTPTVAGSEIFIVSGTDANGCANTATITQYADLCSGITKHDPAQLIMGIYPNPNSGRFVVEAIENAEVTIMNSVGQVVYTGKTSGAKTEVSINTLANGIYFVRVTANGRQELVKIIKQQ